MSLQKEFSQLNSRQGIIFEDSHEENVKEQLATERKEKISYAKKSRSTHHADGLG